MSYAAEQTDFGKETNMNAREAKYMKISDALRTEIALGRLKEGAFLPTEMELMRLFDAGRSTVRHALQILKAEGLIDIRKGSGSVVLRAPEKEHVKNPGSLMNRFRVEYHTQNYTGSTVTSASLEEIAASGELAARFEIPVGTPLYRIQRIWSIEGKPYNYMVQYLRADLFPDFRRYEKEGGRVTDILRRHYDLTFLGAEEHISAKNADFIEANLLGVEIGTALLYTYRIAHCERGIYEYAVFYGNPAVTGYVAELDRV